MSLKATRGWTRKHKSIRLTLKLTLILAVVTAYTVVSECSKAPEPKAPAHGVYARSHLVTVGEARSAPELRGIETAYKGRGAAIVVWNSRAGASGLATKGNGAHDARE